MQNRIYSEYGLLPHTHHHTPPSHKTTTLCCVRRNFTSAPVNLHFAESPF